MMYPKECKFYSCDDMNKLRMGPSPAVSRYHQQNRFFLRDKEPNLNDHVLPHPGYLLAVSGYQLQCTKKEKEAEQAIDEDYVDVTLNDYSSNENVTSLDEQEEEECPSTENEHDGARSSAKATLQENNLWASFIGNASYKV